MHLSCLPMMGKQSYIWSDVINRDFSFEMLLMAFLNLLLIHTLETI